MNTLLVDPKVRWTAATAGGLLVVCGLLALFTLVGPMEISRVDGAGGHRALPVRITPDTAKASLHDETVMRDLTPLFLPTQRNAAPQPVPRREPGESYLDTQQARYTFGPADPAVGNDLPPVAAVGGKSPGRATALDTYDTEAPITPLVGYGRQPADPLPLESRGALLEVTLLATGRVVFAQPLPLDAKPATDQPWKPAEFSAVVDATGLVAPLSTVSSSRLEEVDNHFKNYLARTYRIGDRLRPGLYRVTVGP